MKVITDFQILQRDPDGYARVSFGGTYENESADGMHILARVVREDDNLTVVHWTECSWNRRDWSVDLQIPEGGLYRLEACITGGSPEWSDRIRCVYHVGVGDIYVTAGQSNMTGYGRDNAYDPPVLGVHALGSDGKWCIAVQPLADALGTVFGHPENATGTSPALSFARRLKERLGVPIGILPAAVGATSLAQWHPEQTGDCWTDMCERLKYVGNFKGFIWCQGCADANANDAPTYYDRFCRMIELWREAFGSKPMLTVQLNRWTGLKTGEQDIGWGMIRDAQRRAMLEIPDVFTIPSLDLPVTDGIHNSSGANVLIGERLANAALHYIYHKPGQSAAAVLGAEAVDDTHILVHITPGHRVRAMDNLPIGMNAEDEDGLIECTEAVAVQDGLLVNTERPYTLPAQFHYAWRSQPPVFAVRDLYDMPLLACYGVEIRQPLENA